MLSIYRWPAWGEFSCWGSWNMFQQIHPSLSGRNLPKKPKKGCQIMWDEGKSIWAPHSAEIFRYCGLRVELFKRIARTRPLQQSVFLSSDRFDWSETRSRLAFNPGTKNARQQYPTDKSSEPLMKLPEPNCYNVSSCPWYIIIYSRMVLPVPWKKWSPWISLTFAGKITAPLWTSA